MAIGLFSHGTSYDLVTVSIDGVGLAAKEHAIRRIPHGENM
jgi:hypothetical protein